MPRHDGRALDALRPIEIVPGFHRVSEGSVLYRCGGTLVLCTASIDDSVPKFLEGKGKGWLTAEYQMHPRANPKRQDRDGRRGQLGQRLVGRALRAAVDLDKLGPKTITVDCDVLEADGGTRTASVTGGFVALALALAKVGAKVVRDPVAATSVGYLEKIGLALDLDYIEDSSARVDLNVVATASGNVVEVQGTAEGEAVARKDIDQMIDLAMAGVAKLAEVQRDALAKAGVNLDSLTLSR